MLDLSEWCTTTLLGKEDREVIQDGFWAVGLVLQASHKWGVGQISG